MPNSEAQDASHHTTAHPICAGHFNSIPEAALAVPSSVITTAKITCWSALPLSPSGSSSANIEIPIAAQMEIIARPTVVIGAFALVRIRADRPFSRLVYWGSVKTLCPEPYIHISVAPGETFTWTIRYDFYTLNPHQ